MVVGMSYSKSSSTMAEIAEAVRRNGKVTIVGFGTFKIVKKKARDARLPDGKVVRVAAKSVVKFIPSKKLLA
jgi:DNA-binding protein HU-beta